MAAITAHGKIHGKTIQLDSDPGIPDGAEVEVTVKVSAPKQKWGEGLRRSAGVAADIPEFDDAFEQVRRDREGPANRRRRSRP